MPDSEKKVLIPARLKQHLLDRLKAVCAKEDRPLGWAIEKAIVQWLDRLPDSKKR